MRLGHMSDQMNPHMDNATIVLLTSRENAFMQRLSSLQQSLGKLIHSAHVDSGRHSKFNDAYALVETFLSDVEAVLRHVEPSSSSTELHVRARTDELRQLTSEFARQQANLDLVNELAFRLSLNDADARRLRVLNQQWVRLAADAARRRGDATQALLGRTDFDAKLEDWSSFLQQTERELVGDVSQNHAALQQQQQALAVSQPLPERSVNIVYNARYNYTIRIHTLVLDIRRHTGGQHCDVDRCERLLQNFQQDVPSRQQVLAAILEEGEQMVYTERLADAAEFERQLEQLEERWHDVVRRVNRRKTAVDERLLMWHRYQVQRDFQITRDTRR